LARLVLLLAIVACGFIPYRYEIGGECRVTAHAERGLRAPFDAEVERIHVDEATWVEAGQVIATLVVRDQEALVEIAQAELAKATANLDLLRNGARPEEIVIAEQKVIMAKAEMELAQTELTRTQELVTSTAASAKDLEQAKLQHSLATAGLATAEENLKLLLAGAREEEIRAAEAQVQRIQADLSYNQKLVALGRIVSPISGRIVTPHIKEREGQFVHEGDLIVVVRDDSRLWVEVAADEAAGVDVQSGMEADVRLNGMYGELLTGHVAQVFPSLVNDAQFETEKIRTDREALTKEVAQSNENLRALLYVALDEHDKPLRPGMTGYAQITVTEGLFWEALTRPLARFFRVEVWSWLP
jgi:multidrug resistance efflux pump